MFLELNNRPLKRVEEKKKLSLSFFFYTQKKRKVFNIFMKSVERGIATKDRYKNGARRYGTILLLNWLNWTEKKHSRKGKVK